MPILKPTPLKAFTPPLPTPSPNAKLNITLPIPQHKSLQKLSFKKDLNMQSSEILRHQYLVDPSNPYPYNIFSNNIINNNNNSNNNPLYNFQIPPQIVQELTQQSSGNFSSNSTTSDEADEQQVSLINERKQRRMISNRESARRSRMRKQRHLDELWSQVVWLRNENHRLVDKLTYASECHDSVLQENAQLKEEASELREMINDHMQLHGDPYPTATQLISNN